MSTKGCPWRDGPPCTFDALHALQRGLPYHSESESESKWDSGKGKPLSAWRFHTNSAKCLQQLSDAKNEEWTRRAGHYQYPPFGVSVLSRDAVLGSREIMGLKSCECTQPIKGSNRSNIFEKYQKMAIHNYSVHNFLQLCIHEDFSKCSRLRTKVDISTHLRAEMTSPRRR